MMAAEIAPVLKGATDLTGSIGYCETAVEMASPLTTTGGNAKAKERRTVIRTLTRVHGLIVILRALLPVIWLVVLAFVGYQIWHQTEAPRDKIDASVDSIKEKVGSLPDEVGQVQADFSTLTTGLSNLAAQVEAMGTINLNLPSVPVPTLSFELWDPIGPFFAVPYDFKVTTVQLPTGGWPSQLQIPGMTLLKALFRNLFCGSLSNCSFLALKADLDAVSDSVGQIQNDAEVIKTESTRLIDTVRQWAVVFGGLIVITLLLLATWYIDFLLRSFARGWTMFRSGQDPLSIP